MTKQGQCTCKIERSNKIKQRKWRAFWWTPEFVSVELFKVKKYPQAREILKIFESDD